MRIKERIGRVFTRLVANVLSTLDLVLKDKVDSSVLHALKASIRESIYLFEKEMVKDILFTELKDIDIQNEIKKEREEHDGTER